MLKIECYVPESHLEQVKQALFSAGAGQLGDYRACCWSVSGQGQFEPQSGSQPFIGKANQISKVVEIKIELICSETILSTVINALKQAHPYEEPAYFVTKGVDV
jgi:structural hemagglutinin/hemolysin toxin protein RtxA